MPENESERIAALRKYEILDTPPEDAYDHIAALAAQIFGVPMSFVSLVDKDRIWYKAHHGLGTQEINRDPGFCASAILSPEVYHIRDARTDARSSAHPLVTGEFGLRFYAAAPLRTKDGFNLGTLCVVDRKPRELSDAEAGMLKQLSRFVMDQMEIRLIARRVVQLESENLGMGETLRQVNKELTESEERYRDLFEEAPIAYVHEGVDSKIIRANRAAEIILGVEPGGLTGLYGKDFVPDRPDAQRRLTQALDTVGVGIEANGIVLELCRKDTGKPIWIQWWSKPDKSGKFTRTMFLDITSRISMEAERDQLQARNDYLAAEIRNELNFGDIIGDGPAVRKLRQQIQLVSPTDAAVLICGETGTGKELIARGIHEHSARKGWPLIKVNCGAIPDQLFESEFFGHTRGAFTGAIKDKAGRFELAEGGTLFLDEIGELPLAMQAKLLRVLQEREIERVGGTRPRKVNVRIIAASNRDLKAEVEARRFRQDLFYRLSVFPIEVPPLRERRQDIGQLAAHFVRMAAKRMNRPGPRLTKADLEQLSSYDWPGNIRELQNVVERAVILAQGGPLRFELPAAPAGATVAGRKAESDSSGIMTRREWKRREPEEITKALKQSKGKVFGAGGAAEILGMKPTTLLSRIKALGIPRKPAD